MQGIVEAENQPKSRSDEESINFRPSPNFKHMKKYLKSKFEEAMANSSISQETSDSSLFGQDEQEKVNNTSATAPVVQPPLPPNPPPPDSPTIINLKKEIEDDEYTCEGTSENQTDFHQSDEMIRDNIKTDHSETPEKPEVTMCRNFVRGTCKKGAACIFAHELIISQLPGVYTFCRNFQNTVCTFPKCKFVHATVFEKEYFFRTGYLPPHTLAHLKEPTVLQPPPPPPPPEETATEIPQVYSHGLVGPPAAPQCITPIAALNCAGVPTVERNEPIFGAEPWPPTSPKREWSEANDYVSPRDFDSCDPLAKRCKYCEPNEFRLQVAKNMVEKMAQLNEELEKSYSVLLKRNTKMNKIIEAVFKIPNRTTSASRLSLGGERERYLLTNNVATLLARMLRNNAEDVVPPDAS